MNVLSCFGGIEAGRLALIRAGIEVNNYYSSEVDKFAIKVTNHHFPEINQLGDVTKWREWDLDWSSIDMLIGGSPCQGFSFAGKQAGTKAVLNGEDVLVTDRETYLDMKQKGAEFLSQSYLFWEYVLILDHIKQHNPNIKFLLENVKMKKELLEMIDTAMGVKSVVINSALLSAQNRVRHYWCNWEVTQPGDKGILLKDVLETNGFGSTYNRKDGLGKALEKSLAICASDWRGLNRNQNQTAVISHNKSLKVCNVNPSGNGMNGNVYHVDAKSPTLTTNKGEGIKITGGAIRGRYLVDGKRQDHKMKTAGLTEQRLEVRDDGKTNCLTTVQKDNVVVFKDKSQTILATIYKENAKSMVKRNKVGLCVGDANSNEYEKGGIKYRKLTPTECARLQTFPDGWCESVVSNSQSYKAYGNSWTVDVIAHIFRCMP